VTYQSSARQQEAGARQEAAGKENRDAENQEKQGESSKRRLNLLLMNMLIHKKKDLPWLWRPMGVER
jgi:hypothetical protein